MGLCTMRRAPVDVRFSKIDPSRLKGVIRDGNSTLLYVSQKKGSLTLKVVSPISSAWVGIYGTQMSKADIDMFTPSSADLIRWTDGWGQPN
jgi:hypothetical protein